MTADAGNSSGGEPARPRLPDRLRPYIAPIVFVILMAGAVTAVALTFEDVRAPRTPGMLGPEQRLALLVITVAYLTVVLFGYRFRGSMSAEVAFAYGRGLQLDLHRLRPVGTSTPLRDELSAQLDTVLTELRTSLLSQRKVLGAWRRMHAIEARFAAEVHDDNEVLERLAALANRLKDSSKTPRREWATRTTSLLTTAGAEQPAAIPPEQARAQLRLALLMYYDDRDAQYEDMASWERRVSGLAALAIVGGIALGLLYGREGLFVAGAVGGLLSRVLRVYRTEPAPNDYGLNWSIALLSPLVGALAGWVGVLATQLLVEFEVLSDKLAGVWTSVGVLSLGAAVVFGFSERLVERMLSNVEGRLQPTEVTDEPSPAPSPAPAPAPDPAPEGPDARDRPRTRSTDATRPLRS